MEVGGRCYKEGRQAGSNLLKLKLMADQHLLDTYIRIRNRNQRQIRKK
jgi:hypothetical protein